LVRSAYWPRAWKAPNGFPAIVAAPARESPLFAAAVTCTVPLPVPDAGPVNVNHDD